MSDPGRLQIRVLVKKGAEWSETGFILMECDQAQLMGPGIFIGSHYRTVRVDIADS